MVDSTAIEGQFLIAGAGNKTACEAKGKSWKPNYNGTNWKQNPVEFCDGDGQNDTRYCSCQKS
jgi:hypothetical protein